MSILVLNIQELVCDYCYGIAVGMLAQDSVIFLNCTHWTVCFAIGVLLIRGDGGAGVCGGEELFG